MGSKGKARIGAITWIDLTVGAAGTVRDFYREVVGWGVGEVDMGEYADFTMHPPGGGDPVAGICHARGANADLPAQWLIYITVADLDRSVTRCAALGGTVLAGPKAMGPFGRYAVIRDPAGAVAALIQPAAAEPRVEKPRRAPRPRPARRARASVRRVRAARGARGSRGGRRRGGGVLRRRRSGRRRR